MHGPVFPGVTADATHNKNSSTDKNFGLTLGQNFVVLGARVI